MTAALLEQRRQALAEKQRLLEQIQSDIRRQRFADFQAAEAALCEAQVKLSQLREAMTRDDQAKRVEELHRRFIDEMNAFNSREPWRPPPAANRRWADQYGPEYTEAELKKMTEEQIKIERRDREWYARVREYQAEYCAAATAQLQRQDAFQSHPLHAEIARLRAARDAAAEALNAPIGD